MGSDDHYPEEAPAGERSIDGFWMAETPVTVAQFTEFTERTGYLTVAERPPDPAMYPGADPALLVPGSLVFRKPDGPVPLTDTSVWWEWVPGASWRHPWGPGATPCLEPRMDGPRFPESFPGSASRGSTGPLQG